MHYAYILKCVDNSYYTGCTQDLKQRLIKHQNAEVESTKGKLPVELIFYCAFSDKYKAYNFQKYLKSGSGIAFRNRHLL